MQRSVTVLMDWHYPKSRFLKEIILPLLLQLSLSRSFFHARKRTTIQLLKEQPYLKEVATKTRRNIYAGKSLFLKLCSKYGCLTLEIYI